MHNQIRTHNIKGLVLDIDGVLVGEKAGYNFPIPHPDVITALKKIKSRDIFVSLCTAKPHFAIRDIIDLAELNNLHITDGGGVIIDPINNTVVKKYTIETSVAQEVIKLCLENDIYTEFYTLDNYFMQEDQARKITETHKDILQREPMKIVSLVEETKTADITKIMPIAKDEGEKEKFVALFQPFEEKLTLQWGVHPVALPAQFGIITAFGVSKKQGAVEIATHEKVPFENILGVGDSPSDWEFIKLCGYKAVVNNANKKLKDLVSESERSYIGEHVDENGILDIFSHFNLIA